MRFTLILLFILVAGHYQSQVALSYYPFQSQLSVSTNPDKLLWIDARVETNTFISNMNMELGPMLNFSRNEKYNCYAGGGVNFNPAYIAAPELQVLSGYFISAGIRVKPFEKNRNLHLLFEISPYVTTAFKSGNFRTRLGVGYNFIRKKSVDTGS